MDVLGKTVLPIYFDFKLKKIVICTLTGVLGGVSNLPVKKFCAYFGHIYNFSEYYSYFIMLGV